MIAGKTPISFRLMASGEETAVVDFVLSVFAG
jgi:hypothetical protein